MRRHVLSFIFLPILLLSMFHHRAVAKTDKLTLDGAVREALSNNFLIKKAWKELESAKEEDRVALSDFFPSFSLSYSFTRLKDEPYAVFQNPLAPGGGAKVPVGDRNNFSWALQVKQPIFTGFALLNRKRLAALGVNIREVERKRVILDVTRDVKIAYFRILLLKRYVAVAREEVEQLSAHLRDAESFYRQGMIPLNDLLKSKVALAAAKQKLVSYANDYCVAVSHLNVLLTRPITSDTEVEDVTLHRICTFPLKKLLKKAVSMRPELQALRMAVKQVELQAKLARSDYFPKIYAIGGYTQQGEDVLAKDNDYNNTHNSSVGFQAEWTFFEWGKTRAKVLAALYKKQAIEQELANTEEQIKLQVRQALAALETARENVKTAKVSVRQAKENFRITDLQYKQNITTSTEVLDARTYLSEAEINYYNALYGYLMAKAELERAVGVSSLSDDVTNTP